MSGKKERDDLLREQGWSYEDYAALDDGNRYELMDGKLELMSPAPSVPHQLVSFAIQQRITLSCGNEYLMLNAPVDLILSDRDVLQPDLVLVRRDRLDILSKKGITGIPDLVIEILSPSTLKRDKLDKLKTYARFELPEYWVVEPEQGVLEQYVLNERKYELCNLFQGPDAVTSSRLPCIRFTMEEILDSIPDIKD